MKRNSRLLIDYDKKTCPICRNIFYNKNFTVKYCSKNCAEIAHKEQQRIGSANWRKRQKELKLKL